MKVYFVLGEASGDVLAAGLFDAIREADPTATFHGLAGERLQTRGMTSLFDVNELSVMGLGAVLPRLPNLVRRVYQTVADVVWSDPDVLVLIDAPDFTHAVAKRVRQRSPYIPVINYVCPSVWAWRPSRARTMVSYVDEVLAILPFEPESMRILGGPPTTYVGHPLSEIADQPVHTTLATKRLLVLPGSRRSVIDRMLPILARTVERLQRDVQDIEIVVPTLPSLEPLLRERVSDLGMDCTIDTSDRAFEQASAALATSGTVALDLAVRGIPMVLTYKLDPVARRVAGLIDTWSVALPNLIAGTTIVPENVEEFANPERLARQLEPLLSDNPLRDAQVWGLNLVRERMATTIPASQAAARIVMSHAQRASTAT